MDVTIVGTGNMARAIALRLVAGGHRVTVLGKQTEDANAVVHAVGSDGLVTAGHSGDEIADDIVVLAVYYRDAMAFVEQYGERLSGKLLVDITNPVNETYDALVTPPDTSAAQQFAERVPGARVVKAFNTTFAPTLVEGRVADQPLDVFVAGDDQEGKAVVSRLIEDGGLRPIDAGSLERARELEAVGLLHMSVQEPLGSGFHSALKILT